MSGNFCTCKRCKKEKRKGRILGTRRMTYWLVGNSRGPEVYDGPVSDYVPFVHYLKGRRPLPQFNRRDPMVEY